jgi:hypothetical protein
MLSTERFFALTEIHMHVGVLSLFEMQIMVICSNSSVRNIEDVVEVRIFLGARVKGSAGGGKPVFHFSMATRRFIYLSSLATPFTYETYTNIRIPSVMVPKSAGESLEKAMCRGEGRSRMFALVLMCQWTFFSAATLTHRWIRHQGDWFLILLVILFCIGGFEVFWHPSF